MVKALPLRMKFMSPNETLFQSRINSFLTREPVAWFSLLLILLVTVFSWRYSVDEVARHAQERFEYRAQKQKEAIVGRMLDYERVLRGGAALFASSDSVSRREWHDYIAALQLDDSLPGIVAIGFTAMVPSSALRAHEAAVRAEGFPAYSVHPSGERERYGSVVFVEPFAGANLLGFGYDMYAEPVRREAMERARDSGLAALSGRVRLIGDLGPVPTPGVLLYLPIYRNQQAHDTVEARRAALSGHVFSVFRIADLMQRMFSENADDVEVEIFDGPVQPENLMYASGDRARKAMFYHASEVTIAGHRWSVCFHSSERFEADSASPLPAIILVGGLVAGLVFFLVLYMSAQHRRGMDEAAAELARSRDEYLALVENVPGTVFRCGLEPPWAVQHISHGIEALTGQPVSRFLAGELSLGELIRPEDRSEVSAAVAAAIASRRAYDIAYRINNADGKVQWVGERGRAAYDENGKALWLDGVIIDISEQKRAEEYLRSASIYVRSLIEASLDPLLTISDDGKIMDANTATERITGVTRGRLIGSDFSAFFTDPEAARAGYERVFAQGYVIDYPLAACHASGERVEVLFNASLYHDESGRVAGVVAAARDVTALRRSQSELEETNREIRILSQMSDLLQGCQSAAESYPLVQASLAELFPDASGACFIENPSNQLLVCVAHWGRNGVRTDSFLADDCWALRRGHVHAVGFGQSINPRCKHLQDDRQPYLCAPLLAQGKTFGSICVMPEEGTASEQRNGRRQRLAQMVADSLGLALANLMLRDSLRALSFSDPLTGLFNRRFMEETLARELSRVGRLGGQIAVAMLDVDRFKDFNDSFGHAAGDLVLVNIARLMLEFRQGVDVACRYGGEEFVLILPEISAEAAVERFEQFRQSIADLSLEFEGRELPHIAVSIGVAIFPEHGDKASDLLRAADEALYRAKNAGRNRVVMAGAGSTASLPNRTGGA